MTGSSHMTGADADLWMVRAIIQPFKLEPVTRALQDVPGFSGMTVTQVRGFGHEKMEAPHRAGGRVAERRDVDDFTAKVQIDIAASGRALADTLVAVLTRAAHTGNRGDGKVFVWPLAHVVRIMTGDEGSAAL